MMVQSFPTLKKLYRLSTGEACLATTDEDFVSWLREKEMTTAVTYNNKQYMHLVSLKSVGYDYFISDVNEKKFVESLTKAGIVSVIEKFD